jgi:hypothetical protein
VNFFCDPVSDDEFVHGYSLWLKIQSRKRQEGRPRDCGTVQRGNLPRETPFVAGVSDLSLSDRRNAGLLNIIFFIFSFIMRKL